WNTVETYAQGKNFARWASEMPHIDFAVTIEIPYANASGQMVTQESARAFGHDLARAIRQYLAEV
ncbi:MAG: M14 family zinc carboxypeptidase, partial [Candidatus Zipacnadales bacterium]